MRLRHPRQVFVCVWALLLAQPGSSSSAQAQDLARAFLGKYCVDCHANEEPSGERDLETLDLASDDWNTQLRLQEAIDQLNLGSMPPNDAPQPTTKERLVAVEQMTEVLTRMRERSTSTGRKSVLRRLSRREYRNSMGDLLAIDMTMFDPTIEFPADNLAQHSDNLGDAQVTSGHLLEKYLDAASSCVEKAFAATGETEPREWTFRDGFRQQQELSRAHQQAFNFRYLVLYDHPLNDKPEGAYGHLPGFSSGVTADGMYEVEVLAEARHRDTVYGRKAVFIDLDEPFRLGIRPGNTVLGDMAHTQPIEPKLAEVAVADNELKWYSFRIPLDRGFAPRFTFENGQHDVRGAYQRVYRNHLDTLPEAVRDAKGIVAWRNAVIRHGQLPQIRIHEVRIRGPVESQNSGRTQQILFGDAPFEDSRAALLIERIASRAYRRPATTEELQGLVELYRSRVADGHSPLNAYKDAVKGVLCSPGFLYFTPADQSEGVKLSHHGLAERLSYFLTSTMPDDHLRALADEGRLADRDILEGEARRLLASNASDAFVSDFLDSWLNLRSLGSMPPDPKASQVYYAAGLEPEMKQETRLFLRDLIDRNASVLEFLRGDYSFVNRDLARLYGIRDQVPADAAADFHRVTFQDPSRGGLLGQASVLTVSANGIETSPVVRGVWLLENVLGAPVPPPPDSVPALDPDVRGATSIRDQLARHRDAATCNECHKKIDPLGFALEGFDPIGRTREFYDPREKQRIDTSGVLPGGDEFSGPAELRAVLLKRHEFFVRTVVARLLSHALGRRMEPLDRGEIDRILSLVRKDDFRMTDLILAIVTSDLFRNR